MFHSENIAFSKTSITLPVVSSAHHRVYWLHLHVKKFTDTLLCCQQQQQQIILKLTAAPGCSGCVEISAISCRLSSGNAPPSRGGGLCLIERSPSPNNHADKLHVNASVLLQDRRLLQQAQGLLCHFHLISERGNSSLISGLLCHFPSTISTLQVVILPSVWLQGQF